MKSISKEEFNNIKNESGLKVVDFSAAWCGPCKMLSPILEELSKEMGDSIEILKIDIDENVELAMEYQVSSVPTIIFIKDSKEVDRKVGFIPKSFLKDEIEKYI